MKIFEAYLLSYGFISSDPVQRRSSSIESILIMPSFFFHMMMRTFGPQISIYQEIGGMTGPILFLVRI